MILTCLIKRRLERLYRLLGFLVNVSGRCPRFRVTQMRISALLRFTNSLKNVEGVFKNSRRPKNTTASNAASLPGAKTPTATIANPSVAESKIRQRDIVSRSRRDVVIATYVTNTGLPIHGSLRQQRTDGTSQRPSRMTGRSPKQRALHLPSQSSLEWKNSRNGGKMSMGSAIATIRVVALPNQ